MNSDAWQEAQDLWFDGRALDGRPGEYRGSIVNLKPGTEYKVRLMLDDDFRTEVVARAATWSDRFPIAKTVTLPRASSQTLIIDESGDEFGYVLYTAPEDQGAIIDVQRSQPFCVLIAENTHHVIVRGLVLRNAARHAVRISDHCHDIVIEDCDISAWGDVDSTGYGVNLNAAVSAAFRSNDIERLVIQRNDIHHPFGDANSWGEPRPNPGGDPYHPQGPYGIVLYDTKGNHVIRYNRFYTDDDHYFCDILGAGSNISVRGFPNKDSDIYGNVFERCWDDAIEAEGANENVRIWGNRFDRVYHPIGAIATAVGPFYIWRNITLRNRKLGNVENSDDYGRGSFIKAGGAWQDGVWYGDGRTFVYHNTIVQPEQENGRQYPLGCEGALVAEGRALYNVVSRNNIFTNYRLDSYTFRDNPETPEQCGRNDFDYDLYTGRIKESCPEVRYQQHGIHLDSNEQIVYNPRDPAGPYALSPGSPGHDAGILLPNFNDDFNGAAPDMGAIESRLETHAPGRHGDQTPAAFALPQNYPNPFNASTSIRFRLARAAVVQATVFSADGRFVAAMTKDLPAGYHSMVWDGRDKTGTAAPSGVYLYRLRVGAVFSETKKMVLLR